MKKWKVILGVTGVFALGVLAGALLTLGVVRQTVARGPEGWRDALVRRWSWELRLDRQQRAELRGIVAEAQQDLRAVQQQIRPQVREVLDEASDQVREMLRPDQRAKFEEIVAKHHANWDQ